MRIESVFFLSLSLVAWDTGCWFACDGKGLRKRASFNGEFGTGGMGLTKRLMDSTPRSPFPSLIAYKFFKSVVSNGEKQALLRESMRFVSPSFLNFVRINVVDDQSFIIDTFV